MRRLIILLTMALWLAACAPVTPPDGGTTPTHTLEKPYAPQAGDASLSRGPVFLDETDLLIRESFPPQIVLVLRGNLPTPCHALRIAVPQPDADNKIAVEVYSVVDPNLACTQVLEPFEASILLGTFPSGHYTVWLNGELVGEFDS